MEIKEKIQGFSLDDKCALIVGCGGLGCNIAVHLAGAGIGKLLLCDYDTVNISNLNRQFLYTEADNEKSKALTAKERLSLFAPDCTFSAFDKKITKASDLDFADGCDVIFAAVDNDDTRRLLIEYADKRGKALVIGAIDGFYGLAYLKLPGESRNLPIGEGAATGFSVSSTAGIIGSAQAALGIRYLLTGDEDISKRILIYDENEFSTLKLK